MPAGWHTLTAPLWIGGGEVGISSIHYDVTPQDRGVMRVPVGAFTAGYTASPP
jgi:hypothetical protein